MKRFILAMVSASSFLVACGPSPEQVCKDNMAAECERMYTCDASVKLGSDVASCTSQGGSLCALASANVTAEKLTKAQQCTADLKAQSCDAYKAAKPASCAD